MPPYESLAYSGGEKKGRVCRSGQFQLPPIGTPQDQRKDGSVAMNDLSIDLAALDFALDELPGDAMHHALRAFRELGPVQKTQFLGIPCFLNSGSRLRTTNSFRAI